MAAHPRSSLILKIPPAGALLAALVSLGLLHTSPIALESLVATARLSDVVAGLGAPYDSVARVAIAVAAALLAALVMWSPLYLLFGPGGYLNALIAGEGGAPSVRHADAHPDAPPRKPLLAHADLGVPMPAPLPAPPPAVRPIPADLDQPIAAFHPAAIPEIPREPVRPVTPLVPPPLAEGEWIETVDLTPSFAQEDAGKPTIEALLQRLENARPRRLSPR